MRTSTNAEKEWLQKKVQGKDSEDLEPKVGKGVTLQVKTKKSAVKHSNGFGDVAGMDELKQLVTESFVNVLKNQEFARVYGITPPNLLFYGPPGCGKTFLAGKIADEVGIPFMKIVPDNLASTLVHGTEQKIGEVFRKAQRLAPVIVFFDEFEAMVPQRTNDNNNYQNGETNEFLCMLNDASEKGIYVLAATNHPELIDKAALRPERFSELIYVDMPDFKARESLFRLKLSKLPTEQGINFARLAEMTQGYNCSDINYIVKVASRKMFNASIKEKDKPYKVITQLLLEDSVSHKSPSVTSRELKEFERLRNEFSPKDEGITQAVIGFRM